MENYRLEESPNTPSVLLDFNRHLIEFKGESRPENVQAFFMPVLNWIDDYEKYLYFAKDQTSNRININCRFDFDYFNSSSAKFIMDIILKLKRINEFEEIQLDIKWMHDELDEDMEDAGKEFEDMLGVRFCFVKH